MLKLALEKAMVATEAARVDDERWEELNRYNDNWKDDPLFKDYHKIGTKQKGVLGEYFVHQIMEQMGSAVLDPLNTGHDRRFDGRKSEIKFSLATSKGSEILIDKFMFNHMAISKDWDRLIVCGINPERPAIDRIQMYYFSKEDFTKYIRSGENESPVVFNRQQSGAKGGNDDFMCTKFQELIKLPFVKHIDEW